MGEAVLSVPEFIEVYGEDLQYLGEGCHRAGYFSPKTQTVVKVTHDRENLQHDAEIVLIEQMTEEEKRIFPVISVREFDGFPVIEMRKVTLLQKAKQKLIEKIKFETLNEKKNFESDLRIRSDGHHAVNYGGLIEAGLITVTQAEKLSAMLYKYDQADCHDCNLGFDEQTGEFCVIDLGLSSELRVRWENGYGSDYCLDCHERIDNCECGRCEW